MCGICGKILFDREAVLSPHLVQDMTAMLAHRGPDDHGTYVHGPVGLGHRRLSIIDLAGGHQPLSNEDDSIWLVFNGEIYNHEELRSGLEAKGHRYKTRTDSETIVHAYEEYGTGCVEHFRGMFAFALWDPRDRSLFLARDRFGIKPLYYRLDAHSFSFASEVKALLIDPEFEATLDPVAIYDYFTSFVFGTNSTYREIKRLAPSHWMVVKDGRTRTERYYRPEIDPNVAQCSEAENLDRLEHLLRQAMQEHMMSEVPQGTFLSGGVDSSLITILMSKLVDQPVKTFTIAFEGVKGFDESHYARQVAERYGTDHHVFNCTPEHIGLLPEVLWHLEEPLADAPAIALMMLCREARKEVTVVHCGDGGDEAFGGYTRFYWDQYADSYVKIPAVIRNGILAPFFRLAQRFPGAIRDVGRRAEKFTRFSSLGPAARYMTWFSVAPDAVKQQMLQPDFLAEVGKHRSVEVFETLLAEGESLGLDRLGVMQYHDLYSFISHSLMLKGDKIAMSVGLEGRYPLLDHRLVEFGLSLPQNQKMSRTQLKLPLRKILARYMPNNFVYRRKQGFGLPIEDWFRTSLKENLREAIHEDATAEDGILNSEYLQNMAERLHAGDPHIYQNLWSVYVFQEWRKVYSRPNQVCREHLLLKRNRIALSDEGTE